VPQNRSTFRRNVLYWFLLDGNRLTVAGLLLVGTFSVLLGFGELGVIDLQDGQAVRGVASAFIPGLIAFLSIVLGINQLVLSQEFGSAGEIRDRIGDVRQYRYDVEDIAETGPSPVFPVGFLSFVAQTIQIGATQLKESVQSETNPAAEAIRTYAETVISESSHAQQSLKQVQPGRINALLPVLEYEDSVQIYEGRQLRHEYGDALSNDARQSLSELIDALELFSVARTQFRTTYTQRILARLSRQLLYVGIPALIVVVVLALIPVSSQPLASGRVRIVILSTMLTIGLSPLSVLSAYLLRIATISERTVSPGPFVSRPSAAHNGQVPQSESHCARGTGSSSDGETEETNR